MKLLMPTTEPASVPGGAKVGDAEKSTVPYLIPGSGPYNAPVAIDAFFPEGPESTHPEFIDFHDLTDDGLWNGHRYWAAMTEYPSSNHLSKECVNFFYSDDCFHWTKPTGATNPIWHPDDQLPGERWDVFSEVLYSDNALAYDPDTGLIHIWWREYHVAGGGAASFGRERIWRTQTEDGVTWTQPVVVHYNGDAGGAWTCVSPNVVRVAEGDWRVFSWGFEGMSNVRTLTSPDDPWPPGGTPTSGHGTPWHAGVWLDPETGTFYMAGTEVGLICATSTDGATWTQAKVPNRLMPRPGTMDSLSLYKAAIQPHPDGQRFRLMYGFRGGTNVEWHCAYTVVPRSLWDTT